MPEFLYVGVLNVTTDSFSDGGLYIDVPDAVAHAGELFADGAALVDIGAESTNPRSTPLTAAQEITRLSPLMPRLIEAFGPTAYTLDTYHPETARWAIEQGLKPIINDVSGLHNPDMRKLVIAQNLSVIISHLPKAADGLPTRSHTDAQLDDIEPVVTELLQTAEELQSAGLSKDHIILDPGIGFGKTMRLNWQLLDFAQYIPDYAVMIGYSRKRFLYTDPSTGQEIASAIQLKTRANSSGPDQQAHEAWLAERHARALERAKHAAGKGQTVYVRVHNIPPQQTTPPQPVQ